MIAVVADRPELESLALQIATHLRSRGLAVTRAFRGNSKRQTDFAKREGADAILFVRTSDMTPESVFLSYNRASSLDADQLQLDVLMALHPLIGGLAGADLV